MGIFSTLKQAGTVKPAKLGAKTTTPTGTKKPGTITGVSSTVAKTVKEKKKKATQKSTKTTEKTKTGKTMKDKGDKSSLLQWGKIKFYVKPTEIHSFKGLQIKSTTTTESEENGDDAYVTKKQNGAYELTLTAILDVRLGTPDVKSAAMEICELCRTGASGYLYTRGKKLMTCSMMGTDAVIDKVIMAADGTWIGCEVKMTVKQCSKGSGVTTPTGEKKKKKKKKTTEGSNKKTYTAVVYYSASSGARMSVTATSTVSYQDALKKAWAKVPKNAQWASTKKPDATNQEAAKKTATDTLKAAKQQSSQSPTTGGTQKTTPRTYIKTAVTPVKKK